MRRIFIICLAVLAMAAPVGVQALDTNLPILSQVYACIGIAENGARLSCFDTAVDRLRQAQNNGDVVIVERTEAQEIERDAFGFSLPSLPRLFTRGGNGAPPEAVADVRLEIARVTRSNNGVAFTMTNGQVWAQIDDHFSRNAREGGFVTIRRAAMGSFLMSVEAGGPSIRVRRSE